MKKILSISTVALLALALSGCVNSNGNSSSSVSSDVNNSSSSGSSVNPTTQKSNITYAQFLSIKLSSDENPDGIAKTGDTYKEVEAKLGKPHAINTYDAKYGSGSSFTFYNPRFNAGSVTISFSSNNRADSKSFSPLPAEKLKPTVILKDPSNSPYFNPKTINLNGKSISFGDSYDDVSKQLGFPILESMSNTLIRVAYLVSMSQKDGAKVVTLDFNNHKLTNIDVNTRSYGASLDE